MAQITLLHGDDYLVRKRFRQIKAQTEVEQVIEIAGSEGPGRAIEEGRNLPFFDDQTVIRINRALGRAGRAESDTGKTQEWIDAIGTMASMPSTTTYLWTEGTLPGNSRAARLIAEHGNVEALPKPKGADLPRWVRDQMQKAGGEIGNEAAGALVERTGGDLWRIENECEKLALWCDGRMTTRRDIEDLVEDNSDSVIFRAIDDLFAGNTGRSTRQIESLLAHGQSPYYIMAMLQRECRVMALVDGMDRDGATIDEMMAAIGTRSDFVIRKTRQHISELPRDGVEVWYEYVTAADRLIKSGSLSGELAVWVLTAQLARLRHD